MTAIYCRSGNIREVLILGISRGGQFRQFKNLAKIIIIIALLKKNENSRILNLVKSPKIRIRKNLNTRKLPHLQNYLHIIVFMYNIGFNKPKVIYV